MFQRLRDWWRRVRVVTVYRLPGEVVDAWARLEGELRKLGCAEGERDRTKVDFSGVRCCLEGHAHEVGVQRKAVDAAAENLARQIDARMWSPEV